MKKLFIPLLVVAAVAIILALYFFGDQGQLGQSDKPQVAATIFPLSDITQNIAGNKMEVINLLPSGASPHAFELTPSDIKDLQNTKVVFAIGQGLDSWTENITDSINNVEIYSVEKGITLKSFESNHDHEHEEEHHEHGDHDPHYWLACANAKVIAQNITDKLVKIDPDNASYYRQNLVDYQKELDQTKQGIDQIFEDLKSRELIVFHQSWGYFAEEFDLEIIGAFTPTPGQEPTAQYLKELQDTAQEHNAKAVFSEPQLSTESIEPFVMDLDLKLYELDPLGGTGARDSYINTLLYNAQIIGQALD